MNNGSFDSLLSSMSFPEIDRISNLQEIINSTQPEHFETIEPPSFDNSFEKQAADLIIEHIDKRANKSDEEQRCFNIVLVIIGFLTLIATIVGIVVQVVM